MRRPITEAGMVESLAFRPDLIAYPIVSNSLVSIVICCYNRAHFLPKTLESALAQHYRPVEILVLDDGSTDDTSELVASYGERVRYIRQPNQGIAIARTNACEHARGDYIAFLDDDDIMPPDRINILYNALVMHPSAVFAVGDIAMIDGDGNYTGKRWLPEGTMDSEAPVVIEDGFEAVAWPTVPAVLHSTLFRKADGEKIGWFDPQYKYASEDKDFLARLGNLGPIVYVPAIVSHYRVGHTSLTNKKIEALYCKLTLFLNQLNSLGTGNDKLKQRLRHRILKTLKTIALYRFKGILPQNTFPARLNEGMSSLSLPDRLRYWWYLLAILPAKKTLGRL